MPRWLLSLSLATLVPPGSLAAPQPQQQALPQSPSIRVSVDRVNVGVIVINAHGQLVEDLRREDFHVLDNGIEQSVTDFAAIEEPAQVLFLIEAGPAVYLLEGGHLRAVNALLHGLSPDDRVAIACYDEAPTLISSFTDDKHAAVSALDQLRFNLGFGQLNLASSVGVALDWLGQVPGKKSLVLLSTGIDTSPQGMPEALLSRLKTSDVRILAVSLSGNLTSPQPSGKNSSRKNKSGPDKAEAVSVEFAQAAELLQALASATGGRAYFPVSTKDFSAAYADIAQLVRHEYSLAFVPPSHDGKIHTLEIRVDMPSTPAPGSPLSAYHVDHRSAYMAPSPE